jgi:hypothetical protein
VFGPQIAPAMEHPVMTSQGSVAVDPAIQLPPKTATCNRWSIALILSISAILAFDYFTRVEYPRLEPRLAMHTRIVTGVEVAPYRYRVLVPYGVDWLMRGLTIVLPHDRAFRLRAEQPGSTRAFTIAYVLYDLVAIALSLVCLHSLLLGWFSRETALIGSLLAAITMELTFRNHFYQPWSLAEMFFNTAAVLLMVRRRYGWLSVVVLFASLNRETGVFIPIMFFLAYARWQQRFPFLRVSRTCLFWTTWYSCISVAVLLTLRLALGSSPMILTLRQTLEKNTEPGYLVYAIFIAILFFGVFWLLIVRGFSSAPRLIRKASGVLIFYFAVVLLWGGWAEIRYFTSYYALFIPLGLSALYTPSSARDDSETI